MGSQIPLYTLTPNSHQDSNVKSLNVKLEGDACYRILFYDISTKNKGNFILKYWLSNNQLATNPYKLPPAHHWP